MAEKLITAMFASLSTISDLSASLVKDPSSLHSAQRTIRSQVMSQVLAKIPGDIASYPVLRDLFHYWLDNEMLQIERRMVIVELKRKISQLDIKMSSLNLQLHSAEERTKIQRLLTQLAITNSDINFLAGRIYDALGFATRTLSPIVRLHYPSLFDKIGRHAKNLRSLSLDVDVKDFAQELVSFLDTIDSDILRENAFHNQGSTQYQNILLRIPRPGIDFLSSQSPVADEAMRELIWSKLLPENGDCGLDIENVCDQELRPKDSALCIELRPTHFYRPDCIKGRLNCEQFAPVIDSLMLIFSIRSQEEIAEEFLQELNSGPASIMLHLGPAMEFITEAGTMNFRITGTDVGSTTVPLGFVRADQVDKAYGLLNQLTTLQNCAYGFSPFTSFRFRDLDVLRTFLRQRLKGHELAEMMILARVKFENGVATRSGVATCVDSEVR